MNTGNWQYPNKIRGIPKTNESTFQNHYLCGAEGAFSAWS